MSSMRKLGLLLNDNGVSPPPIFYYDASNSATVTKDDAILNVLSITRTGNEMTVTTDGVHNRLAGDFIDIDGANEGEYNGVKEILATPTTDSFTAVVLDSPATPATGTITSTPVTLRVSAIDNQGTIGGTSSQASISNQLLLNKGAIAGRDVLENNGISPAYSLQSVTSQKYDELTIMFVYLGIPDTSDTINIGGVLRGGSGGVADSWSFLYNSNNQLRFEGRDSANTSLPQISVTDIDELGVNTITLRVKDDSIYVHRNQIFLGETIIPAGFRPLINAPGIGLTSGFGVMRGNIGEILIWDSFLSDIQVSAKVSELSTKWGVTSIVPSPTFLYSIESPGSLTSNDQTINVTSVTRSGSTASVILASDHGMLSGDIGILGDLDQAEYNGANAVTVTGSNSYDFTVSGTPATPATGTGVFKPFDVRVSSLDNSGIGEAGSAIQNTISQQLFLKKSAINGHDVLYNNDTNPNNTPLRQDVVDAVYDEITIMFMFKIEEASVGSFSRGVLNSGLNLGVPNSWRIAFSRTDNRIFFIYVDDLSIEHFVLINDADLSANILTVRIKGGEIETYINDTLTEKFIAPNSFGIGINAVTMGAAAGGTSPMSGYLGDVYIWAATALNDAQLYKKINEFAAKYGITL